ncbi:MAG: tetratricopeptide repeat protein [Candidatus Altimarinota bacterium]
MWKKVIVIFSIVIVLSGVGYFGYNFIKNGGLSQKDTKIIKNELLNIQLDNEEIDMTEEGETTHIIEPVDLDKEAQMEVLRKRFSLRGTIARGDNYSVSNQPILALNEYIKALRQSPNDEQIIKKLAGVYFDLKRYKNSGNTFKEILPTLNYQDKEKYLLTLLYTTDFKSAQEIKNITHEIKNIGLSKEDVFYYINAINCTINFHECKKNYDTYFKNFPQITSEKLKNIQQALTNYQNFQIENLYYKDALLIGALFQEKLYTISNFLSINMLKEKPNYQPILLILGKGYYELGDLENAKKYLETYYSLDPKELNITYILGDINFRLKDYLTSNLYFNSALKNGFEPKIELQRKLAYNYYLSGDKRSMLNVFGYLVDEKGATIDDFSLGIYHAILEGRNANAITWANKGIEKFKNIEGYEIFYGYLGWIYREEKNYEKAGEYLKHGLQINGKNPLITLNLGYLEEAGEKYNIALMYFKRTINLNGDGEFGELAKAEMTEIEKYLKTIE